MSYVTRHHSFQSCSDGAFSVKGSEREINMPRKGESNLRHVEVLNPKP